MRRKERSLCYYYVSSYSLEKRAPGIALENPTTLSSKAVSDNPPDEVCRGVTIKFVHPRPPPSLQNKQRMMTFAEI